MAEEMIIEVDKDDKMIGLMPRSEAHRGERFHRASHLLLLNPPAQILLQKRASIKRWYPGMWSFSVDETVGNESYRTCMERGVLEELRVTNIRLYELFKYFTSDSGKDTAWRTIFMGITHQREFPFNKEEIEELKWFYQDELKRDMVQNQKNYAPYLITGLKRFFSL